MSKHRSYTGYTWEMVFGRSPTMSHIANPYAKAILRQTQTNGIFQSASTPTRPGKLAEKRKLAKAAAKASGKSAPKKKAKAAPKPAAAPAEDPHCEWPADWPEDDDLDADLDGEELGDDDWECEE